MRDLQRDEGANNPRRGIFILLILVEFHTVSNASDVSTSWLFFSFGVGFRVERR